jgi:hypothetical protein
MTFLVRLVADMIILAILSLVALLFSGCMMGMGYSTKDKITAAAQEYNDGVLWGKLEQASLHIKKEQRNRFWEKHKALEDDLELADYEMVGLDIDKSDKKHDRATARMVYTWSLKTEGLLRKTNTEQKWEETNGDWIMMSETRTKGAPLTIFEEPQKNKETPKETAAAK